MVEEDAQERLENAMELVEEFEKEIEIEKLRRVQWKRPKTIESGIRSVWKEWVTGKVYSKKIVVQVG